MISYFENVFIPRENVFMCGEWEFAEYYITYFTAFGRSVQAVFRTTRTKIIKTPDSGFNDRPALHHSGDIFN